MTVAVQYYKRYRMEVDLRGLPPPTPLPAGFTWVAWEERRLDDHASVKHRSFEDEFDAFLFPCLANRLGCLQLMHDIRYQSGFLPEATWLIRGPMGAVGAIQGIVHRRRIGMIQNVGVVPMHRGKGLGFALVLKALIGFRQAGLIKGMLEVTAQNIGALRIYRRLGFRHARTVYKAVFS